MESALPPRLPLPTMLALSLALAAQATAPLPMAPEPIPTAARHAGTYHVATGTWTRTGAASGRFGSNVLYDNTAPSGYFTSVASAGNAFEGAHVTDYGGIPGPTNGDHAHPDIVDAYPVDGFEIGYCDTAGPGGAAFRFRFYDGYDLCSEPDLSPVATIDVSGLPAASGCWIVTIDLQGTPDEFCLYPDGGRLSSTWDDVVVEDGFSWSYESLSGSSAGFLIAGDPSETDPNFVYTHPFDPPRDGTGTFYGTPSQCASPGRTNGTGYLTFDVFTLIGGAGGYTGGCRFFGGYRNTNGCGGPHNKPYASFHMKLLTQAGVVCDSLSLGQTYCTSNPNSTGAHGEMLLLGSPVAQLDGVDLVARALPPGAFGLFITSQSQGFTPNPAGSQGNLCLGTNVGRFVAPGQVQPADAQGMVVLSTTAGQWSLASIPAANGSYAAMAGGTSNFQLWHRDQVGGAATSNFTDARTIVWR